MFYGGLRYRSPFKLPGSANDPEVTAKDVAKEVAEAVVRDRWEMVRLALQSVYEVAINGPYLRWQFCPDEIQEPYRNLPGAKLDALQQELNKIS